MPMPITILRTLRHDVRGVALIEFVLVFPLLLLLLIAGVEVARHYIVQQKLERSSYVLADIVSRYRPAVGVSAVGQISLEEIQANVFPQLGRVMAPQNDPQDLSLIITSVVKADTSAEDSGEHIRWQVAGGGTLGGCVGTACVMSEVNNATPGDIGAGRGVGGTTSFPSEIASLIATMPIGDNVIVVEVFYHYRPLYQQLLQRVGATSHIGFTFFLPERLYAKRIYIAPRNGALMNLPPLDEPPPPVGG